MLVVSLWGKTPVTVTKNGERYLSISSNTIPSAAKNPIIATAIARKNFSWFMLDLTGLRPLSYFDVVKYS